MPALGNRFAIAACALLAAVLLFGGSARSDAEQLLVLRPLSVVAFGIVVALLPLEVARGHRLLLWFMGSIALVAAAQIVPLAPSIWTALPGRAILAESTRVVGIETPWRPLSMVPDRTINSFFALFAPVTMLLLALTACHFQHRLTLLIAVVAFGLISALVGALQLIGPPGGPLHLYRVTNENYAVGMFANRNHQAMMLACLFPLLAVLASERWGTPQRTRFVEFLAIVAGLFLVPMILVTGSRAGLLLGLAGLATVPFLYPLRRRLKGLGGKRALAVALGTGALALAGVVGLVASLSKAEALRRLFNPADLRNIREESLSTSIAMMQKYLPFGSGFGTFSDVYKIDEPDRLLAPTYLNQAHNDWLQLVIEGGLPAVLIALVALFWWCRIAVSLVRSGRISSENRYVWLGLILCTFIALGSAADYPIRVPSLACVLMIAVAWVAAGHERPTGRGM